MLLDRVYGFVVQGRYREPRLVVQDGDLVLVGEEVLRVVVEVGEVRHVAVLGPVGGAGHAVAGGGQLERLNLREREYSTLDIL